MKPSGLALGSPWLHMSARAGGSPIPSARLRRGERDLQDGGGYRRTDSSPEGVPAPSVRPPMIAHKPASFSLEAIRFQPRQRLYCRRYDSVLRFIEPCLPSPADRPPSGSNWIHEIKHDGYRLMARRDPVGIRLITRRGNDWSDRFPLVVEAVNHLKVRSCLIDGEVVCCDERGLARFDVLRRRRNEANAFLYAFDLLELDGTDLRREPIEVRKATLASILRKSRPGVRLNEHLEHDCGLTVFQHACKIGLRGHRVQAARLALPLWPVAGLAEVQEPAAPAVKREAEEDWGR